MVPFNSLLCEGTDNPKSIRMDQRMCQFQLYLLFLGYNLKWQIGSVYLRIVLEKPT